MFYPTRFGSGESNSEQVQAANEAKSRSEYAAFCTEAQSNGDDIPTYIDLACDKNIKEREARWAGEA